MEKIENWNEVEAKGMEDFKSLPIGKYECVIKEAGIYKSEQTGKETFRVAVDIANGDYKDYYKNRFESNPNMDKRWDNNATRYLAFEGENASYFKGFITSVELSNPNYKWDWDETKLIGKKICGVFQYEEYQNQEGKKGIKVRLSKFRSMDKFNEIEVSDGIRMLNGTYMSYDDYMEKRDEKTISSENDMVEIDSNFLD